ncbi:hypothetical protein ACQ4LE_002989 [Meloidogyne hapla]
MNGFESTRNSSIVLRFREGFSSFSGFFSSSNVLEASKGIESNSFCLNASGMWLMKETSSIFSEASDFVFSSIIEGIGFISFCFVVLIEIKEASVLGSSIVVVAVTSSGGGSINE